MLGIARKTLSFSFIRYIVSGGTAASVNFGLLFLLVEVFGVHYLLASAIAISAAIIVSFTMHKFFTFREHTLQRIPHQFIRYLILLGCTLAVDTALMWLLVDGLGAHYFVAQILVSGTLALGNFFIYRFFVFHASAPQSDTREEHTTPAPLP